MGGVTILRKGHADIISDGLKGTKKSDCVCVCLAGFHILLGGEKLNDVLAAPRYGRNVYPPVHVEAIMIILYGLVELEVLKL